MGADEHGIGNRKTSATEGTKFNDAILSNPLTQWTLRTPRCAELEFWTESKQCTKLCLVRERSWSAILAEDALAMNYSLAAADLCVHRVLCVGSLHRVHREISP